MYIYIVFKIKIEVNNKPLKTVRPDCKANSKNFNAKVNQFNQNVDGRTSSKPELLCNPAKN